MDSSPENQLDVAVDSPLEDKNKKGAYPTFIDLVAIFGVFVLTQVVCLLFVKMSLPYLAPALSEEFALAWSMLLTQLFSLSSTIIFAAVLRHKRQGAKAPIKLSFRGFDPTVILGGLIMLISLSIVIEPLISLLPPSPSLVARGWPLLVAVVFGAPLLEEILCRGVIFESIRAKRGVVVAWLLSSLFFGLMHIDPAMVVNAFFMGLVLCYIYIRSGSLIAPMILHALNNAIAYLLIILGLGDNTMLRDLISSDSIYYIVYGVAVLLLLTSGVLCARQFRRIIEASQTHEEELNSQSPQ
ncbi:MAG: type II CAAX endopeptidase family protein [Rikenellaceae bacterium]